MDSKQTLTLTTVTLFGAYISSTAAVSCSSGSRVHETPPDDGGSTLFDGAVGVDANSETGDAEARDAALHDGALPADAHADTTVAPGVCPPTPTASGFASAPHAAFPTVGYGGGPMVTTPRLVTFTFTDTPNAAALASFGTTLLQTPWFSEVTREYCEGDSGACITPGPEGLAVPMGIAAGSGVYYDPTWGTSTTGTDVRALALQQIGAAVTAGTIPEPDGNAVYVFYFPGTAQLYQGPPSVGSGACGWSAYHSAVPYSPSGPLIAYAIIADCAGGGLSGQTFSASHELIEAITDLDGNDGWTLELPESLDAAWTATEVRNVPWAQLANYDELADNCEGAATPFQLDGGQWVTRVWSRAAASRGANPCIPVPPGEVYRNASPDKSLYVAEVGIPFSVTVSAWSDSPTASWNIKVEEATPTSLTGDGGAPLTYLDLNWASGTCVNNGYQSILSVTLRSDPALDSTLRLPWAEAVILEATSGIGQIWPFAVTTAASAAALGIGPSGVTSAIVPRGVASDR